MPHGALENEWAALVNSIGCEDLLPVVSNQHATISPKSKMKKIGKTPSRYNSLRQVGGIKEWTKYKATKTDIDNWLKEPDYGVCIQTRHVRAFDVDIKDIDLANEISNSILSFFPNAHFRTRNNSAKFLFPFFLEGDYTKRTIVTEKGIIEFLANGNQFVAAGTHPSGERYNLDPSKIIKITQDEFNTLFSHIVNEYATENYSESRTRNPKCEPMEIEDDTVDLLKNKNLVLGTGHEGQLFIKCPFENEHTTPNTITDAAYFPAGTRAYYNGHFHCFHAHCQHRTDDEFKLALDIFTDFNDTEICVDTPRCSGNSQSPSSLEVNAPYIPNGLIKDTSEWITESAFKQQPILSLLSVLTFAGAVFGRRYATEIDDTRTNLYTVAIAGTGEGKDYPRKCIKNLSVAANLESFIGTDEIKSAQGMVNALPAFPSRLMLLDEWGAMLTEMTDPKAPAYQKASGRMLMTLYSSSNSVYKAGEYANRKEEQVIIHEPNLCIYGTTTLKNYSACVSLDAIQSGELNRFIVATTNNHIPYFNNNVKNRKIPASLIERWSNFSCVFSPLVEQEKIIVSYSKEAVTKIDELRVYEVDMQRKFSTATGDGTGPLYARYTENTIKLAMIYAIGKNKDKPVITLDDLRGGEDIVRNGIIFLQAMLETGMVKNTTSVQRKEFVEDQDRIIAFIKTNGPSTQSDILRKIRYLTAAKLAELLTTMCSAGILYKEIEKNQNSKKKKKILYNLK